MPETFSKRQKSRERQERQKEKESRRAQRKVEKANKPDTVGGEDPDIAGIIPGPQPIPED